MIELRFTRRHDLEPFWSAIAIISDGSFQADALIEIPIVFADQVVELFETFEQVRERRING